MGEQIATTSTDDKSSTDTTTIDQNLREETIQTAIKFLQNHNVVNAPIVQKQKFLRKKGLTDEEIRVACQRAGAYELHERQTVVPPGPPVRYDPRQLQPTGGFFDRLREIVHNLAIISAIAYAIYKFYEKFIRPYLFGDPNRKSIEERLECIDKRVTDSMDDLKEVVTGVRLEIDKMKQYGDVSLQRQLSDIKSDINTVKGILVSTKQFASVPNTSGVSIPAWQLLSSEEQNDGDGEDVKSEYLMELGSASGSEHEHATKTSESSLEIMERVF